MLKHLQWKFIGITMALIGVVMIAVIGGVCAVNYHNAMNSVETSLDSELDRAATNQGQIEYRFGNPSDIGPRDQQAPNDQSPDLRTPQIGGPNGQQENFVPVAVFIINTSTRSAQALGNATAVVSSSIQTEALNSVNQQAQGVQQLNDLGLLYKTRTMDNGLLVAFTDNATMASWRNGSLILVGAGLGALVVLFLVTLWLSRWALRPVQEAWDKQRRFIADASHDLKTPLTVILANTSILQKHPDDTIGTQQQWIESTAQEAENMQGLVNDLLLLARLDEQQESADLPASQTVELSEIVDREVLQFESVAFERNVTLDSNTTEDITIQGNASQLGRLAETLIDNACKYTPSGGTVSVTLTRGSNGITLTVHNTGAEIPSGDLAHVFDRFYRVDSARTESADGAKSHGLGLAIAKGIVEDHHGTIEAASDASGTSFTVHFPATM